MVRVISVNIGNYSYSRVTDKPVVEQEIDGTTILQYDDTLIVESDRYFYIEGNYTSKLVSMEDAKPIERESIKRNSKPSIKIYTLDGELLAIYPSINDMAKIEGITLTSAKRIIAEAGDKAIVKNWRDIPVVYVLEEELKDILYMISDDYEAYTTPSGRKKVKIIKA